MTQVCLVSQGFKKYTEDIRQTLKDFEVKIIIFKEKDDLHKLKNHQITVVFWDGDKKLLEEMKHTYQNVFIFWIHTSSTSVYFNENYAFSVTNMSGALEFLKLAIEDNNFSQEFSNLVKLKRRTNQHGEKKVLKTKEKEKENKRENQESTEIQYKENPYYIRSKVLQKSLFSRQKIDGHKTVGIWSPMPCRGVTTFTLNFAFYLANNHVFTAVLEGLTENHELKAWLQRYTKVPNRWVSFAKALHSNEITDRVDWTYRNVKFLPLDKDDAGLDWNTQSLEAYMTTSELVDVTLVDLPSGKMEKYTKHSLHFIDEIWVVVDDVAHQVLSWKDYLRKLNEGINIPVYLLYNKVHKEFSPTKYISEQLALPLLAELPDLHKECLRNNYETTPVYFNKEVKERLDTVFLKLAKHVIGENFTVSNTPATEINKKEGWFSRLMKPIEGWNKT